MELVERERSKQLASVKYTSIGAEFSSPEHMKFRLGIRIGLNDNEVYIYIFSIGISILDIVSVNIAGVTRDNNTKSLALELG